MPLRITDTLRIDIERSWAVRRLSRLRGAANGYGVSRRFSRCLQRGDSPVSRLLPLFSGSQSHRRARLSRCTKARLIASRGERARGEPERNNKKETMHLDWGVVQLKGMSHSGSVSLDRCLAKVPSRLRPSHTANETTRPFVSEKKHLPC